MSDKTEIAERVIEDVERHASECRNALTRELTGYFVPIDQWRAIRALLRSSPGTTEVLARVHDLLAEFRSDQYRVLDNEPDPFRQGWRQRSVQVVEALDAALSLPPGGGAS